MHFITFEHGFEHEFCVVHLLLPGDLSGFTRKMLQGLTALGVASQCQVVGEAQLRLTAFQLAQSQRAYSNLENGQLSTTLSPDNPGQRALNVLSSTDQGIATATSDSSESSDSLTGTFFSLILFLEVPASKSKEIQSPHACLLRLQWASGLLKRHRCFTGSCMQVPLW